MKKDDLLLLALYLLLLPAFFMMVSYMKKAETLPKLEAKAYVEKLYQTPVKSVLIKNTDASIRVEYADQLGRSNGFQLKGSLDVGDVKNLKIAGDTLLIEGDFQPENFLLILQKAGNVSVDTKNAPGVSGLEPEVLKDTLQDGL